MRFSFLTRLTLRTWMIVTLVFLYVPLVVVAILSFNTANSLSWPPKGFTFDWWNETFALKGDNSPRSALWTSVKIALTATAIALVIGTLAAIAMQRYRFFGKSVFSFVFVLPIALPGIVTGMALQNAFKRRIDIGPIDFSLGLGYRSLVVAHATFCVVIAYNNVIARLRRSAPNLLEASADLGADGMQTFRYVTFPLMRSALVAGGLLAFALSFDEIVVTTFTAGSGVMTLPQWILGAIARPNNVPQVNVMATFVMLVSIPVAWLAQKLSE
ncbi:ABC transporter permease [Desertimonas flava]|jgi:putative spermidine/putrescine transport system permease protein|uniref:ABC transporter permease n=1 Tax=Desertimonas flava TaxID=2064846 RepID=UPI000E344BC0|nr:ABC transporter permease [Desertimonas flava]